MLSCRAAGNRKAAFPEMSYLVFIEFMAVIVGAIYGVLLAARKGMDIRGVFAVAFAVAFGGGTLRDLFLSRDPLFWIGNPHYPVIVFAIGKWKKKMYMHKSVGPGLDWARKLPYPGEFSF